MPRDRFLRQSLGTSYAKIKESRVLLVGAGGIGCELLKDLVLTGFGEVHIVDLDTIDLSNLNRQFLFRQEHIKKSKALVAKESAAHFNPQVKIEAYHANIKDSQFNVDWFRKFTIVFNALDNLDARRHVNKMCLAARTPLIESGTTGFDGQVQVIAKRRSECYDCNTKEVPKSFPVCTIRSTPSQPIHCIVWAKNYLFTEIYGISEEDSAVIDNSEDSENAKEMENLKQEAEALKKIRASMGTSQFARNLFQKVFKDDILRLRSMEDMWKNRRPPNRLDFDSLSTASANLSPSLAANDQAIWNETENFVVFNDSLRRLNARIHNAQTSTDQTASPVLEFDKDDEDILDFVASSANLRSIIFGMEPKSKFEIKQMAGNIIPAIATTNAMTAGLCVLQALKIIKNNWYKAKNVFLERSTSRVINSEQLHPANPSCAVCSVATSELLIDSSRATLKDLVDLLRDRLGYDKEFTINNDVGTVYDPDLEDNLSKKFPELGVKSDSFLTIIDDDDENPHVNLSLNVLDRRDPSATYFSKPLKSFYESTTEEFDPISLVPPNHYEQFEVPRKTKEPEPTPPNGVTNGNTNGSSETTLSGQKRKRSLEAGSEDVQVLKREKIHSINDDSVIIEDANDGAIVIDD